MSDDNKTKNREMLWMRLASSRPVTRQDLESRSMHTSIWDILRPESHPSQEAIDREFKEGIMAIMEAAEKKQITEEDREAILSSLMAAYTELRLNLLLNNHLEHESREDYRDDLAFI